MGLLWEFPKQKSIDLLGWIPAANTKGSALWNKNYVVYGEITVVLFILCFKLQSDVQCRIMLSKAATCAWKSSMKTPGTRQSETCKAIFSKNHAGRKVGFRLVCFNLSIIFSRLSTKWFLSFSISAKYSKIFPRSSGENVCRKLLEIKNNRIFIIIIIINIILSCHQRGYPWSSLTTAPYRSSLPAGPQGYTPYSQRAAVCRFELVALLLLGHVKGSIGVHPLLARRYFSRRVLHVWFVMSGRWSYSSCFMGCCLQDLFNRNRILQESNQRVTRWIVWGDSK